MRIITGLYKGRRLKTPEGLKVRPTSDRLRETLFNVLAPRIEEARFLDLCAGSGAVGIEALSRGASETVFVEVSRKAAAIIGDNLRHCGIVESATVIQKDVLQALRALEREEFRFDLIYFDPPYDAGIYSPVIRQVADGGLLAPDGILIVEHRRQMPLAPSYGDLRPYRVITQGESCLTFFQYEADGMDSNSFTEND
ncbi:MAG: 16S rRNA (guanine(966)-N(2))-methyltransferase RsmD [Acidobacteria bacterium]|nr:16S rRNA (guanine(966)-N(2))-methyltransferase RsmD [Acidobacteriota bacterium]